MRRMMLVLLVLELIAGSGCAKSRWVLQRPQLPPRSPTLTKDEFTRLSHLLKPLQEQFTPPPRLCLTLLPGDRIDARIGEDPLGCDAWIGVSRLMLGFHDDVIQAVLAHELGHFALKHHTKWVRQKVTNAANDLFTGVGYIDGLVAWLGHTATAAISGGFSRADESAADLEGAKLLTQAMEANRDKPAVQQIFPLSEKCRKYKQGATPHDLAKDFPVPNGSDPTPAVLAMVCGEEGLVGVTVAPLGCRQLVTALVVIDNDIYIHGDDMDSAPTWLNDHPDTYAREKAVLAYCRTLKNDGTRPGGVQSEPTHWTYRDQ